MTDLTIIGIDLAKNYIQIHGINNRGKAVLTKRLKRENFLSTMANLPPCLIGMEACGGAHYWARELISLGFDVKLISPRKVKMYVEHHKSDARDAKACAEAVSRSHMSTVPIKTQAQSELQTVHRARSHLMRARTALMNMLRGLLLEQGVAIAKGSSALRRRLQSYLSEENPLYAASFKSCLENLYHQWQELEAAISHHTALLTQLNLTEPSCQRLNTIPGIGPITATAILAKIGNGSEFRQGRELSAYLGLVPRQQSSGDKTCLTGITKHGDRYVRQLLIHGGRSSIQASLRRDKASGLFVKTDAHSQWMRQLVERIGMNKASVAVANKHARLIVGLLKQGTVFEASLAHAGLN